MPSKNAQPIPNTQLRNLIKSYRAEQDTTLERYLSTFRNWLQSSTFNKLEGLDAFAHSAFTYGTTQAFDHFYLKHRSRRFRFFTGEFMYHKACMKHGFDWAWLHEDILQFDDALIISLPFSDLGVLPADLDAIFRHCNNLNIPVLLDLAYFPLGKDLTINLDQSCVETVCASLSKVFDGAQYLRAGIRFQRENIDDGIDIANSVGMVPQHTINTAVHLMDNCSMDYNWKTYGSIYDSVCKELKLTPTNCLMFGISETEFNDYNRGNSWNRVCISQDIGNKHASTKS
jgi:hypothetical protein